MKEIDFVYTVIKNFVPPSQSTSSVRFHHNVFVTVNYQEGLREKKNSFTSSNFWTKLKIDVKYLDRSSRGGQKSQIFDSFQFKTQFPTEQTHPESIICENKFKRTVKFFSIHKSESR